MSKMTNEEKSEWDNDNLFVAFIVLGIVLVLYWIMPDLSQAIWLP